MDEDFFLIWQIKNGRKEATERFVKKYYDLIVSYCARKLMDPILAEDMAQQTFLQFFQAIGRYEHTGKAKNYLYVIAGNVCKNFFAKKQEIPLEELPEKLSDDDFETQIDKQLGVRQGIDCLPEKLKEVILLYYFQQLKIREISEILKITPSNVKYRLRSAKNKLAEILRKEDFER